jgi:hypothetical protein
MMIVMMMMVAAPLGGCGGGDTSTSDLSMPSMLDFAMTPPPPTLKSQIDRMGRPGINTALNHTFDPMDATKGMAKDTYNAAAQQTWATFIPEFAKNQAILDGLDTVCGNQVGAGLAGDVDAGTEYAFLAAVLADDQLYVDTTVSKSDSTLLNYLAVEGGALSSMAPTYCGGRTPLDDVMKISYAVLSGTASTGNLVDDGVVKDADPATPASLTTFPFLNAPN